jgi:hypothetical protein
LSDCHSPRNLCGMQLIVNSRRLCESVSWRCSWRNWRWPAREWYDLDPTINIFVVYASVQSIVTYRSRWEVVLGVAVVVLSSVGTVRTIWCDSNCKPAGAKVQLPQSATNNSYNFCYLLLALHHGHPFEKTRWLIVVKYHQRLEELQLSSLHIEWKGWLGHGFDENFWDWNLWVLTGTFGSQWMKSAYTSISRS